MRKISLPLVAIAIIIFVALLWLNFNGNSAKPGASKSDAMLNKDFNITQITIMNDSYYVYTAITLSQLEEGYMNSSTIGNCDGKQNCIGMIFIFSNYSNECFWMKNTIIPLRQIWLNNSGYPVYSYNAIPLSQQTICAYGRYVLETNPNFSVNGQVKINGS